jgi:hypothetical protein
MAARKPTKPPKPPAELKDLSKFLERHGYSLAFPFDNVREPGYVGGFNAKGQEIVVDNGRCLKGVEVEKPGTVALGNYKRSSSFSWGSFFRTFGGLLGVDLSAHKARDVRINFPKPFLQTRFITELAIQEYADRLSATCKEKLTSPENFLIVQVLETDAIEYEVVLGKKLDTAAQADLAKVLKISADQLELKAAIEWRSTTTFSLVISGKTLTVGYKTAKAGNIPITRRVQKLSVAKLAPQEVTMLRLRR